MLKNTASTPLLCFIVDATSGHNVWKSIIYKESHNLNPTNKKSCLFDQKGVFPVPLTLLPGLNLGELLLKLTGVGDSHGSLRTCSNGISVPFPPPFSKLSLKRGVIKLSKIRLDVRNPNSSCSQDIPEINVINLRIGFTEFYGNATCSRLEVPEQRMILFQPSFVFKNYLQNSICIQVRSNGLKLHQENDWETLGDVKCGEGLDWMVSSTSFELRVKLLGGGTDQSNNFPLWSSNVTFSLEGSSSQNVNKLLLVEDMNGCPLSISIVLEKQKKLLTDSDAYPHDNIKTFASLISCAPRVLSIFVPYWIIDSSGMNLEYTTERRISGQSNLLNISSDYNNSTKDLHENNNLGLAYLLKDETFSCAEPKLKCNVIMIGDNQSSKLSARTHININSCSNTIQKIVSPWSESIHLNCRMNQKISVGRPSNFWSSNVISSKFSPLALNANIVKAPEIFGGFTKFIQISNRYTFSNALDCDIEIISTSKNGSYSLVPPTIVKVDEIEPFHFDDLGKIRARPREFGWDWSGAFSLTKNRGEIVLRMRNKLTSKSIIVNVEVFKGSNNHQIVFRTSSYPPFRLENHTVCPLQFVQQSSRLEGSISIIGVASSPTLLLPYHDVEYAWDEPDACKRCLEIETVEYGLSGVDKTSRKIILGKFTIENLTPGTRLNTNNKKFSAELLTDGPTRVLRITDSSLPKDEKTSGSNINFNPFKRRSHLSHEIQIKLSSGIGISICDWQVRISLKSFKLKRFNNQITIIFNTIILTSFLT